MKTKRAINIFINGKINNRCIDERIFDEIVKNFEAMGFEIDVSKKLRMIRIKKIGLEGNRGKD